MEIIRGNIPGPTIRIVAYEGQDASGNPVLVEEWRAKPSGLAFFTINGKQCQDRDVKNALNSIVTPVTTTWDTG